MRTARNPSPRNRSADSSSWVALQSPTWRSLAATVRSRRTRSGALHRGFTLPELLLVVTFLGVLASVLVPAIRSQSVFGLEATARTLAADLRLARSLALRENMDWTVTFDVAGNAYELTSADGRSVPPEDRPLDSVYELDAPYRVQLSQISSRNLQTPGVFLLGAVLKDSVTQVSDVTFTPTGGTGPTRSEDTVLLLSEAPSAEARAVRLRVYWVTGRVEIGPVETLSQALAEILGSSAGGAVAVPSP